MTVVTLEMADIKHPDYILFEKRWEMIRDVLAGKEAIDKKGTQYLPKPSAYSSEQYLALQIRAVLYNATSRTLAGYLGAVYRKEADLELPSGLKYLEEDADGQGNNLEQFSKKVSRDVIGMGRQGILVDYPQASSEVSLEDERNGNLRAHISSYTPESIVNWSTKKVGAKTVLSAVMLLESRVVAGNGNHVFARDVQPIYRLLELDENGQYVQRTLVSVEKEDSEGNTRIVYQQEGEIIRPTLPNNRPLNYIPFIFVGSETATPTPDLPPLYDLAQLNIAHYRQSADYEQASFMLGQPTSWISGCDAQFIEANQGNLVIGSGATWLLPEGALVGMLESSSDKTLIERGMEAKKSEMIGLGARIVQDNSTRGSESTESVQLRRSGEASQLACIADNVSSAMVQAFKWVAAWMGEPQDGIQYKLNKDFFAGRMSPQEQLSLVQSWQSGAISHEVLLNNFRGGEIISELTTNEDVLSQIDDEGPPLGEMDSEDEGELPEEE